MGMLRELCRFCFRWLLTSSRLGYLCILDLHIQKGTSVTTFSWQMKFLETGDSLDKAGLENLSKGIMC